MTSVLEPSATTKTDATNRTVTAPVPLADDSAAGAIRPISTRPLPRRATRADRTARSVLLRILQHLGEGRLTVIEADGTVTTHGMTELGPDDLDVTVRLHTPAVWREVVLKASRGMGESYVDGWWSTDDLVGLVQLLIRNLDRFDDIRNRWDKVTSPVADVWRKLRPASRLRDRREIAAHYDLGNDFFELFLDQTMAYSCGLYASPDVSLEAAQRAKFDRLLRSIDLGPNDHLVEIGTGWGGLAVHAAQRFGARVTTTTISTEQHAYATELVKSLGLEDRVEVLLEDYRDLTGTYDKLVSIEMIEAIGAQYLDTYFGKLASLLKPDGVALVQAITIEDHRYKQALNSVDFIKRHVFPGSFIPSVAVMLDAKTRSSDLALTHMEDFGSSYARTLHAWRQRFMACLPEVRAQGFDDRFIRMWEFYLAYCEGGFLERSIGVAQLLLAKPGNRDAEFVSGLDAMRHDWIEA